MSSGAAGGGAPQRRHLAGALLRLCRALRERGVPATPAEAVDAARALEAVGPADRGELRLALRAVLVGRVEEYPAFDAAFAEVFGAGGPVAGAEGAGDRRKGVVLPPPQRSRAPVVSLRQWLSQGADAEDEPLGLPIVGVQEARGRKDFSAYAADELEQIERAAARLARRLVSRPSRRWRPARRGPRAHPRRTLRRAFRTGGDPVELAFRKRKIRRTKLVALCDVSGSMDLYSRFLLQFLYALQKRFSRVETFVFSTGLRRVTEQLRGPGYRRALDRLAEVAGWSGGTRIGESLAEFQRDWGHTLDRRTVVVILSDGWDTGEPEVLSGALREIRRRARRVIWLNPLLGSPGYQPLTRGMQAALPHVDVFAPAHSLESLEALARHLAV